MSELNLKAASLDSYSPEDRAFFDFWYGHMLGDLMQPPLCGVSHSTGRYIWDAARRTAPVSAPMGQELPPPSTYGEQADAYTDGPLWDEDAVRNAIAPYAERIRQLERELAERKTASIDTPMLRQLMVDYRRAESLGEQHMRMQEVFAYIDGRTGGTAPPACRNQGGICACRSGGSFGGCAIERAAAPTPLNSGKEEA
jgi:hypothetical protein